MVTAIRARGVTRRFGATVALAGVSLDVERGEAFGLLGRNGAGKTTLVAILAGLRARDAGEVSVAGGPVGLVAGTGAPFEPDWSPARCLRHFAKLAGMRASEAEERARALARSLAFEEHAERPLKALSAGTLRKVEIARALLPRPSVLFLDEPTRELDLLAKDVVWRLLEEARSEGATIFLTSHDSHEIERVATRVGILARGRLAWTGDPRDLAAEGGLASALAARLAAAEAAT